MGLKIGLLCLLGILVFHASIVHGAFDQNTVLQNLDDPEGLMVDAGVEIYKQMISSLKDGVKGLFIAKELTMAAKTLAELDLEMGERQKLALDAIVDCNAKSIISLDQAKWVVTKLKDIADNVLYFLDEESFLSDAIDIFVEEGNLMEQEVAEAITKLTAASQAAVEVKRQFDQLNVWATEKKKEISKMTDQQIAEARRRAYTGAAACLVAGPFAVIACPIWYAVSISVTEAKHVKQIREAFEKGFTAIDNMKTQIADISVGTLKLVDKVNADKVKMVKIQNRLNDANELAKQKTKVSYTEFQASIQDLLDKCDDYLKNAK